ncbi:Phage_lysozyme2 domain-containing protein [Burkholderia cepacia]|uniref:phage tail tip lysozyme n=1 Tax=Burkholderia cepacia TaxID=292 RepID=UPI00075C4302|nr:phage tail tip lysozyme [Burkholderia cepacia]CAG9268993.1 Phage_lysozyme2 domain-containing protein [Burkholderia cepacia]
MADSSVIREFLVALGFKVDQKGLKSFTEGVEVATKSVEKLVLTVTGSALAVGAGVTAFASRLESLYFVAQRTGASAQGLRAFEFAAKNMGISAGTAAGSIENLARFLRNNPGGENYLKSLDVQTRDANGQLRDTVDIMSDLGAALAKKPYGLASQYGSYLGIDENLLLAMRNGEFDRYVEQYRKMSEQTGLDQASDDAHQFMVQIRDLTASFENLGTKVEGVLLHKLGPQLAQFASWMDDHGATIANRVADIATAFVNAATAMGPPLKWMADKFLELDKATDGWSTRAFALLGMLRLLGGSAVIGGIGSLATAIGAVGAAFAGWKIGDSVRDIVDKFITDKSGGKYRSLWDIFTGTDRRGLDSTGGYTQAEIDSMKDGGGAKLTGPRGSDANKGAVDAGESLLDRATADPNRSLQARALMFFEKAGWTAQQAAGVVSNLWSESKLRAGAVGDNGSAFGIGQWHADRQADFAAWAGKNIRDSSLDEQLAFVNFELTQGKESAAGVLLRAAQNANQAGQVVSRYYERPSDADGEASRRGDLAAQISATVNVNIDGASDPHATARAVASEFHQLNRDLLKRYSY